MNLMSENTTFLGTILVIFTSPAGKASRLPLIHPVRFQSSQDGGTTQEQVRTKEIWVVGANRFRNYVEYSRRPLKTLQ